MNATIKGYPLSNALAAEEQKLLACIHCGLCLEACPTYTATGDENDGPRGRLYLMRAVAEDRLANTSHSFSKHIDRCLGCRACEQVCPAGVQYGQLLEASREEIISAQPRSDLTGRILRFTLKHIWPFPKRLRLFFTASRWFRDLGLAQVLLKSKLPGLVSARAEFALALLVNSRGQLRNTERHAIPAKRTAESVQNVMLFRGCVGEGLFDRVNRATERALSVNGYAVASPHDQVCCGALHAHAGDLEGARKLARQNIAAFGPTDDTPIVTNAGGCGAMLASYEQLFSSDENGAEEAINFSARVRDVGQQLKKRPVVEGAALSNDRVTYDTSCHLLYGQHAGGASLEMLLAIPELNFVKLEGDERCCGGAGIYNLLQPELSRSILEEKLNHIGETNASVVATGNPGCQMQIGAGACLTKLPLRVCHPVELLDEAYARAGFYEELRNGEQES